MGGDITLIFFILHLINMFQLQLRFFNQGDWENTVYKPMPYDKALKICEQYRNEWKGVHSYRIIPTGASK